MKVVTNRDGDVMVTMHFSSESRYEDVCALLDSYGISVSRNGLVYIQCPVIFLEPGYYATSPGTVGFGLNINPVIDESLNLRMIQYEPHTDLESTVEHHTRWPFYVHHPLSILFRLGDNWWQYDFTPNKTYVERHIEIRRDR